MGVVPVIIFTALWGVVGIVLPFLAPKGPNRGIVQCVLMLTAATCWLFWLCCYMAQMNPLIGPRMHSNTILIMAREWGNGIDMTGFVPPNDRICSSRALRRSKMNYTKKFDGQCKRREEL